MSLRDKILACDDLQAETIEIPEWGVTVKVIGMTGKRKVEYIERAVDPETGDVNFARIYPELVIATCFDPETGEPVFEPEDRDAINEKNGRALERIGQAAMRLSGMGEDAVEAGKGG